MFELSFPVIATWVDAGLVGLAGALNVAGLKPVRRLYSDWDIPQFYQSIGLLLILAAIFLTSPEMRAYGIFIAAPILFGTVVILLSHQRYLFAAPVAAMMAGLVVATLAVAPLHPRFDIGYAPSAVVEIAAHAPAGGSALSQSYVSLK